LVELIIQRPDILTDIHEAFARREKVSHFGFRRDVLQTLAIMGLVRRWQQARAGAVTAECGTGKTLISLVGAIQTHAEDRPFTALAMVPPQLVEKWCREAILTLPRVRVFTIDGLRTPTNSNSGHRLRGFRSLRLFPP
jgi:hypothetical protein